MASCSSPGRTLFALRLLALSPAWLAPDKGWRRRLGGAAFLSLVVHAALSPLPLLLGIATRFFEKPLDEPSVDEIPIELLAEPSPEPQAPPPPPKPVDVGPPEPAQAPAPPAQEKAPEEPAPPKPTPTAPPPKPPSGSKDPVALAGDAGKLADSNANVRALLYADQIRDHVWGREIGQLLSRAPQWSDFFGPADIDPINDLERILVAGPSLRNTTNIVAVVQHRLPPEVIQAAFESLAARGGEILGREPLIARAEADRAERIFAAPNERIVVVTPPSAAASIKKIKKNLSFPAGKSGVAAQLYVKEITKLLRMFGVNAPETLSEARAEIRPNDDGGVLVELTLEDSDKQARAEHARDLEILVSKATRVDFRKMGALGALAALAFGGNEKSFIEEVEFKVKGEQIVGTLRLTKQQLRTLLDFADAALPPLAPRQNLKPTEAPKLEAADLPGVTAPGTPAPEDPAAQPSPSAEPQAAPKSPPASPDPEPPGATETAPPAPEAQEQSPARPLDEPRAAPEAAPEPPAGQDQP